MKRMTDAELQGLWAKHVGVTSAGNIDFPGLLRAIESAAYERAAQACQSATKNAPWVNDGERVAEMCADAIIALKDSTP